VGEALEVQPRRNIFFGKPKKINEKSASG